MNINSGNEDAFRRGKNGLSIFKNECPKYFNEQCDRARENEALFEEDCWKCQTRFIS